MITRIKAILYGALAAVATVAVLGLAYTAYQDHQILWRVVGVLSQPPVQAPAATEKK